MKKLTLTLAVAILATGYQTNAQGFKGAFKKAIQSSSSSSSGSKAKEEPKKKEEKKLPEFQDATGISGTYYAASNFDMNGRGDLMPKKLSFEFIAEKDGNLVNQLKIYTSPDRSFLFNEKSKESKSVGMKTWRTNDFYSVWLMQIEDGIFMLARHSSTHNDNIKGSEKVVAVLAKDESKLADWDLETAQAYFEGQIRKAKKAESDKLKARLTEDYPTYKNNVGKVVFVPAYTIFNYNYRDQPKEDEKKFIKTANIGEPLYFGAYFSQTITAACGSDCEMDIEYEMNGVKASRVELRKTEAKWNKYIKKKDGNNNQFCYNSGHQIWSPRENIMDYAAWYVLHNNKSKMKAGGKYPLTVRVFASRDGNRGEKLAEGTITLVYTDKSAEDAAKVFKNIREVIEDE